MMKKCNSTDLGDVIVFCKNNTKRHFAEQWDDIYKNTANVTTIIAAAAFDVNIECKVTPIWEQIADKKDFFSRDKNRYWSVVQSLNILEEWCEHHCIDVEKFAKETFDVCHKIMPKINSLHITGVTNSGKSYVLRSIRNGLMNCGRMGCQASDNVTFGTCVDKTLVYTDEVWFTPQDVEEAKCILEGTETYVNVKHRSERLLRMTPCISTSNSEPWKVVLHEKEAIQNRMYHLHDVEADAETREMGKDRAKPADVAGRVEEIHKQVREQRVSRTYHGQQRRRRRRPAETGKNALLRRMGHGIAKQEKTALQSKAASGARATARSGEKRADFAGMSISHGTERPSLRYARQEHGRLSRRVLALLQ